MLQEKTLWIYRNETVASSGSPITLPWRNAEALNGGQFFIKYGGAANFKFDLRLSPVEANLKETDANAVALNPANAYEEIAVLASGAHGAEGFFIPTAGGPWDSPFKSWSGVVTISADLTNCYFALCSNGLGGG